MQNIQSQSQKSISTSELANILKTSNKVILENSKKCLNKNIENGVLTYFSEEESTLLIDFMKKNNNRSDTPSFTTVVKVETSQSQELKLHNQFKEFINLDLQEKINFSFQCQADIISQLNNQKNILEKQVEINQPKVEFYNTVMQTKDQINMSEVAKLLDIKIGRNKLFQILREKKILQWNNEPYQQFVDSGYFKLVENVFYKKGETQIYLKTVISQKGLEYINKIINNEAKTNSRR